jgi:hypothetical protein
LNKLSYELPGSGGSPIFNTQIGIRLLPFDEQAMDALLHQSGSDLSDSDCRFIRRVSGGHPYLAQAMAAALSESTGDDRYVCGCQWFYERISHHFDEVWHALDDHTRTMAVLLSLVELGHIYGSDFDHGRVQWTDDVSFALRDLVRLGLAEPVEAKLEARHLFLWQEKRWSIKACAFAWWIYDQILVGTRASTSCSEWLTSGGYSSLLAREQWDDLLSTVKVWPEWAARGIGALAQKLCEELVGTE